MKFSVISCVNWEGEVLHIPWGGILACIGLLGKADYVMKVCM
jgi:hypothetical protein